MPKRRKQEASESLKMTKITKDERMEGRMKERERRKRRCRGKRENGREVWRVLPADWKFNELEQRERALERRKRIDE